MGEYTLSEVERLHGELAKLYRLGRLTPQEDLAVRGLWARIERLEAAHVAATVREAKLAERERSSVEQG